jgi:hypothetical protein
MKGEHSIERLCEVLEVARSGYYRWKAAPITQRKRQDAQLASRIAVHHRKSRGKLPRPLTAEQRPKTNSLPAPCCPFFVLGRNLAAVLDGRHDPQSVNSAGE